MNWYDCVLSENTNTTACTKTDTHIPVQVRGIAGDLVEEVKLLDSFTHPKTVWTEDRLFEL